MIPNIAIIGIGGFGSLYLKHLIPLAKTKKINLVAAVVRSPEKNQSAVDKLKKLNCQIFPDSNTMYQSLTTRLDIVAIPTGIDTHSLYTCEALANNCNVMVEKPAAGTVKEVEHMIQAELNAKNNWVMVGFQHISAPEVQEIKTRLIANEFGKVKKITAMGRWARADSYYQRNDWAGKIKTSTGAIVNDSPANNAFAHFLNLALFWAGKKFELPAYPVEVKSKLFRSRLIETFDTCDIEIATDSQIDVRVLFTHACDIDSHPKIKIECENATIIWSLIDCMLGVYEVFDSEDTRVEKSLGSDAFVAEFSALIKKHYEPTTFVCTLQAALAHTQTIEMLHQNLNVIDVAESDFSINPANGQRIIHFVKSYFDNEFNVERFKL